MYLKLNTPDIPPSSGSLATGVLQRVLSDFENCLLPGGRRTSLKPGHF